MSNIYIISGNRLVNRVGSFFFKKARDSGQPHLHGYTVIGNKKIEPFAALFGAPVADDIVFYHYIPKTIISKI